jgi:hypothetical protein
MLRRGQRLVTNLGFACGLFGCVLGFAAKAHDPQTISAGDQAAAIAESRTSHPTGPTGNRHTERLLTLIVTWLSANFELPAHYEHPAVVFLPPDRIAGLRYGSPLSGSQDVVAVYHDNQRTIYLPEGWTGKSPAEVSILVHELVHHLQNVGKQFIRCPQEREKEAYAAQEAWLGMFGQNLAGEFGIDAMTLKISTSCL